MARGDLEEVRGQSIYAETSIYTGSRILNDQSNDGKDVDISSNQREQNVDGNSTPRKRP